VRLGVDLQLLEIGVDNFLAAVGTLEEHDTVSVFILVYPSLFTHLSSFHHFFLSRCAYAL
jgi:hypothetical protein